MTELPQLFLSREAQRLGADRELRQLRIRGDAVRVATGVYVSTSAWSLLDVDERYRLRVLAASQISDPLAQFSHDSAAAMWRLPSIGPWPHITHELTAPSPGGTSRVGIRRHGLGLDPHPETVDGVTVTSLARTLVDMSCSTSFVRAVAMVDAGLGEAGDPAAPTKQDLHGLMDELAPYRGLGRAVRVVEFASAASGSPGESFARVQFRALGYPDPELQVEFFDERGSIGFADFFWRELGLIGEFDGRSKYGRLRKFQSEMTLEQILLSEKEREDRMRRVSRSFVRLDWARVSNRRALADFLRPHGLIERGRSTKLFREPISAW